MLVEALGSSATPFVPLPFVDDYLFARLLRRTARKVLERKGQLVDDRVVKALVEGYLREGDPSLGSKAVTTAARFIVRKVAVVLDVADIPAKLTPAMFACARVAGWSAHVLEQKRAARLIRPSARYTGPGPRSLSSLA